jgi:hypothetical protein
MIKTVPEYALSKFAIHAAKAAHSDTRNIEPVVLGAFCCAAVAASASVLCELVVESASSLGS